ncbi:alpha/beta hydrolase [Actinomadura sp. HBU206391]|uniref:alpha/beta hydrolase n=1 Tax=Actinomadura sp. HBU206391 TaxID=2731692 RepID=UPI0016506BDC|nr:alpha/beta hydrolase [Actinomadura sp. HBU206391]MBC6460667.1 alpha/beta hydrolase [Actinomadura sp. HBU206391]
MTTPEPAPVFPVPGAGTAVPPRPSRVGDHLLYADATVSRLPGFRPLTLDLLRPADAAAQVPTVIWIHGGAWLEGSNKHFSPAIAPGRIDDRLLDAGFAVALITYRFSGEAPFPAQLVDVKAAIRWLRHNAGELGLDPMRFAVWGESAGGHLASLACLTPGTRSPGSRDDEPDGSDAVQAGVVWYGPSNLLTMQAQSHPAATIDHDHPQSPESLLLGGPVPARPDEARRASPVNFVTPAAPPMLLVHGVEDVLVPAAQSEELYDALNAVGADVALRLVPNADHCFVGADLGPLVEDAVEFLRWSFSSPARRG